MRKKRNVSEQVVREGGEKNVEEVPYAKGSVSDEKLRRVGEVGEEQVPGRIRQRINRPRREEDFEVSL